MLDEPWFYEMRKLYPGSGDFGTDATNMILLFTTYLSEKEHGREFVLWLGEHLNKPENAGKY